MKIHPICDTDDDIGSIFPSDIWCVIFDCMGPSRTCQFLSKFAGRVQQFGLMNLTSSTRCLCHQWIQNFHSNIHQIYSNLLEQSQNFRVYRSNCLHPFEPAFFRNATLEEIIDLVKVIPKRSVDTDVSFIITNLLTKFRTLRANVVDRLKIEVQSYGNRSFGEKHGVNYYFIPVNIFITFALYLICLGISGSYSQDAIYIIAEICLCLCGATLVFYFFYVRWFSKRIEDRYYTLMKILHTQFTNPYKSPSEEMKRMMLPDLNDLTWYQRHYVHWNRWQQFIILSSPLYVVLAAFCLTLLPLFPENERFNGIFRRSIIFTVPMTVFQAFNFIFTLILLKRNLSSHRRNADTHPDSSPLHYWVILSVVGQFAVQTVCIICPFIGDFISSLFPQQHLGGGQLSDVLYVFLFIVPLPTVYFLILVGVHIHGTVLYVLESCYNIVDHQEWLQIILVTITWDILSCVLFVPILLVEALCLSQVLRPQLQMFSSPYIWCAIAPLVPLVFCLIGAFLVTFFCMTNHMVFGSCCLGKKWESSFRFQNQFVCQRYIEVFFDNFAGLSLKAIDDGHYKDIGMNGRGSLSGQAFLRRRFTAMVYQEFDKLILFDPDLYYAS